MDFLIWHLLRESARRSPEKEALAHGEERLNYGQVARRVDGLAVGLRSAGLRRGDRMGIYLEASIPQVISIFGISRAEAVYVPVNALLHAEQVIHIARDCAMKGLITTAAKLASLADVLPQIPSLEFLVVVGSGEVTAQLTVHPFEEFCARTLPADWREMSIEKDLAAILYTSGSTGKPKGVMLSHANVVAGSRIVSTYLGITDSERILAVLPFSFDAGMNQLMTAFEKGGTCVLINFVFAREIVQVLLKEKITGLAGVPTL
jgi:acyl-CoA synthetase (AMP-forming)/AMP-acid ligase II